MYVKSTQNKNSTELVLQHPQNFWTSLLKLFRKILIFLIFFFPLINNIMSQVIRVIGEIPDDFVLPAQLEEMMNEVKFGNYVETGQYMTEIDLGQLIKRKSSLIIYSYISCLMFIHLYCSYSWETTLLTREGAKSQMQNLRATVGSNYCFL